jgi:hypothetical protein
MNEPGPAVATAEATKASSSGRPANPYVGPRPFRKGEFFFGREREATSLTDALLAGRVVLLHSPSGAGKTSLIQASVVPTFESRGFQICVTDDPKSSMLRVKLPPPADVPVENRYVFSVVTGLVGHLVPRDDALRMTIPEALSRFAADHDSHGRLLIIIDQLEEILTIDPGDIEGQTEFFRQLGEALDDSQRWGLLAMREDYMGGLDRFRRCLPGQLRCTYRLDLLREAAALRAVQEPARKCGTEFEDEAALMLVNDLRQVHSGTADQPTATVAYPYVEPVLLQVVCYSLFRKLSKARGGEFTAITVEDVQQFRSAGNTTEERRGQQTQASSPAAEQESRLFDNALAKYYSTAVRDAVGKDDRAAQRTVRDWIDRDLITARGLRKQTRSKPSVADPDTVLSSLRESQLIRDDPRPGGIWWELSHDRLVRPIREDNRIWRVRHLEPWQVAADDWERSGHDSSYLLRDRSYLATPPAHRRGALTSNDQLFLRESGKAYTAESKLKWLRAQRGLMSALLMASLLINVLLFVLWRLAH